MRKTILTSFLLISVLVPSLASAASLSELYQQLNFISLRLSQLVQLFALRNPNSQLGQVAGVLTPTVDLKINGVDKLTAKYNSALNLNWSSSNSVKCAAFGSLVPTTSGSLWNDQNSLPTTGSITLQARHQTLGFSSPLQLTIQCVNSTGQTTKDTVEVTVVQ